MRGVLPLCSLFLLGRKEAAALAALEGECFSLPWSLEQYQKILPDAECFLYHIRPPVSGFFLVGDPFAALEPGLFGPMPVFGILDSRRTLMAFLNLGLNRAAGELEVYNIAVRSQCRQLGLAGILLGSVLTHAPKYGYERVFLEVREGNAPALALYSSLGFTTVGRRKRYYTDNGEDALIMTHPLAESNPGSCKTLT